MDGIVSFLDSKHNQLIEELWAELKQEMKSRFDITHEPIPGESSMEGLHRRPLTPELLKQVYRVREQFMQGTNGKLFEDSTEIIRQQREERTRQLMGEDEE